MTTAVLFTIFASFLASVTNHIDKFMITGIEESKNSIKILLVFSTFIAGIVLTPIWLILSNFAISINTISLISVLSASFIYIIATALYFKSMEKNDASIVVVMSQMVPVFSYVLALILFKENLSTHQLIGAVIIILSAVLISYNFDENNKKDKWIPLILMASSSFLYAVYFLLFDVGIRNSSYTSCAFWFQIGFLIIGIVLFSISSFRKSFLKAINKNGKRWFSLNILNEALNLGGNLLLNLANVTIPLALCNVLNGFQGAFVFILGFIGIKLFPKYFKENLNKKVVIQKIGCIILSIIGLAVMFI